MTRRQGAPVALTEFCRRCEEFFALVADPAEPAARANAIVTGRPREVESARKFVLSIERNHEVIGIIDLLEGFPQLTEWYVGLFLLVPEDRNQGLGRAVWTAIEDWMRTRGASTLRLIVQEQNPAAARFWRSVGFEPNGQVHQVLKTRTNLCWQFGKTLAARTQ